MIHIREHRLAFFIMSLSTVAAIVAPLFLITSCQNLQRTPQELKARETLRAMTHGSVPPSEDLVAKIENDFPRTTAGSLAKIVHARIKLKNDDYASVAALLDSRNFADYTTIGDYALWMRGNALEQLNRRVEARAAYEKLARDFPNALRARDALLRVAQILMQDGQTSGVPLMLKPLVEKNDATALLATAKANEQTGDPTRALADYRRIYFYAPVSAEATEAAAAITRLGSSTVPANGEEANRRAMELFSTQRWAEAYDALTDALTRFPAAANRDIRVFRVVAAANARKFPEAVAALNQVPAEERAGAMMGLANAYGRAKQWAQARSVADEMRKLDRSPTAAMRTLVQLGQRAEEAKDDVNASYFYRAAVNFFPGNSEVTPAHFYLAWQAHEAKNFTESSRLLTEHLAVYAGNNTDFRGKAGYWAARDSERAGKLAEARAIYQGLLARYDANWYGYLAQQRLDDMDRNGNAPVAKFAADSPVGRAVANLQTVTVAEDTAGPSEDERIAKADQLSIIGADDSALEELRDPSARMPNSPRVNLAIAKIYRVQNDNVQALNY